MGRCPTWKRVATIATWVELLLASVACNFEHYPYAPTASNTGGALSCNADAATSCQGLASSTGGSPDTGGASTAGTAVSGNLCPGDAGSICEPACTIEETNTGASPSSLVAYFSFDGANDNWLRSDDLRYTLQAYPFSQAASMRDNATRVNGTGSSLLLDGTQFVTYAGHNGDRLFPAANGNSTAGFTIMAYFSAEPEWPDVDAGPEATRVMPIVSTMGPDNCGYQLDLRWTAGDNNPSLVFAYGSRDPSDAGQGCVLNQLTYRTPVSAFNTIKAWGVSHWHWAVASYESDPISGLATLALYFDGNRVADDIGQTAGVGPPIAFSAYTFYLGASGHDSQKLKGTIDQLALFDKPLLSGDPWQFLVTLTPSPGPSHCVWYPWESRPPDMD